MYKIKKALILALVSCFLCSSFIACGNKTTNEDYETSKDNDDYLDYEDVVDEIVDEYLVNDEETNKENVDKIKKVDVIADFNYTEYIGLKVKELPKEFLNNASFIEDERLEDYNSDSYAVRKDGEYMFILGYDVFDDENTLLDLDKSTIDSYCIDSFKYEDICLVIFNETDDMCSMSESKIIGYCVIDNLEDEINIDNKNWITLKDEYSEQYFNKTNNFVEYFEISDEGSYYYCGEPIYRLVWDFEIEKKDCIDVPDYRNVKYWENDKYMNENTEEIKIKDRTYIIHQNKEEDKFYLKIGTKIKNETTYKKTSNQTYLIDVFYNENLGYNEMNVLAPRAFYSENDLNKLVEELKDNYNHLKILYETESFIAYGWNDTISLEVYLIDRKNDLLYYVNVDNLDDKIEGETEIFLNEFYEYVSTHITKK